MTVLAGLFERRGLNNPSVPLSSASIVDWLGGAPNETGIRINEVTSLSIPAVWRAVSLIAGTCAGTPLKTYRAGTRTEVASSLLANPNPDLTPYELWELAYVHALLWGDAFLQKIRNGAGNIVELWPIQPNAVRVAKGRPTDDIPDGKVFGISTANGMKTLTSDDILHIPGLGYDGLRGVSVVRMAQQSLALAVAAERHGARFFANGNMLSGILQTDQKIDDTQAEALSERWKLKRQGLQAAHEVAVLGSGAKFQPISMPNTDAQFLESRSFQVVEVARWFGTPPHLLMETDKTSSWGAGIEEQTLGWIKFTLQSWFSRFEQRVTKTDEALTFKNVYAKYDLTNLMRGDSTQRAAYYTAMRNVGAFSVNQILEMEDMPGIGPEGDTRISPMNMEPLGSGDEPPTEVPA